MLMPSLSDTQIGVTGIVTCRSDFASVQMLIRLEACSAADFDVERRGVMCNVNTKGSFFMSGRRIFLKVKSS
jgi:hypothetical protein